MFLFADGPDDVKRLRDDLTRAGFTASGVAEQLGPNGFGFLARNELGPVLRRTNGGSPRETLIRLFVANVAVSREQAARALPSLALEACEAAEVLAIDGDRVRGRLTLMPTVYGGNDWLVPSDLSTGQRAADYVLGVGPASMTLAGLTIRQPVRRCLDLGAGSGVQALFASRHAEHVVATDRNARAVAFAEFATRLNGIANVEGRAGDLFEPVAGESFDLIVSNPPFVISPEGRFIYRDSGLAGDEVCRRIVTEAPLHLEDGGWCQLLGNWAHLKDQHWQDRLAEWIDDIGCDAWVVQSRVEDAETYASTWIGHDTPGGDSALFDEWMHHYEEIGLEAVGFGLITLRRTTRSEPWICLEELAQEFVLPCGNDIAAAFDRAVWLADYGDDDEALLNARLRVSIDARLRHTQSAADGQWFVEQSILQLDHGLHYAGGIDAFGADLIAGCDGTARLGELVQRLATTIGADAAAITPHCLAVIRPMIQQGFVTPV